MPEVLLFGEDTGHAVVLQALVLRLASERAITIDVQVRRARGGHGQMLKELRAFTREFERGDQPLPDLLVIGRDANCEGYGKMKQRIDEHLADYPGAHVLAVPDPHIERWLLLDSAAFKTVLGHGCSAPDYKCEKDRYKTLLAQAIREAGVRPLFGGIEHAEDLVNAMNLSRVERADASFGHFLKDLRAHLSQWGEAQ
jgi:hypothetical protein